MARPGGAVAGIPAATATAARLLLPLPMLESQENNIVSRPMLESLEMGIMVSEKNQSIAMFREQAHVQMMANGNQAQCRCKKC